MLTLAQLKQLIAAAEIAGAAQAAEVSFVAVGPIAAGGMVPVDYSIEVKRQDVSIVLNENSVAVPTITQADKCIFKQGAN